MKSDNSLNELIEKYMMGVASEDDVAQLNEAMISDATLRQAFLAAIRLDTNLRDEASDSADHQPVWLPATSAFSSSGSWIPLVALAALVAILATTTFLGWRTAKPIVIAELVSSENAAWESHLPTLPGSELTAGFLKLNSGIATIRFRSGAEVVLDSPAHLVLETPMRGKLLAGSAVIDVPESAVGFVMETPVGHAVDHGTKFTVTVDGATSRSKFEVLSGEISVFEKRSDKAVRLTERQAISLTSESSPVGDVAQPSKVPAQEKRVVRIGTDGRETSIIANNQREAYLHPDMLMAKKSFRWWRSFDRRSIFAFDISGVDISKIKSARVRLNLVPSGLGLAAHLPQVNTFSVYGLKDEAAENWSPTDLKWEDAPVIAQCVLLGSFDVPRSIRTGSFSIETDALAKFLRSDTTGEVDFLLVRETGAEDAGSLVHAFANSQHPGAAGPTLELNVSE